MKKNFLLLCLLVLVGFFSFTVMTGCDTTVETDVDDSQDGDAADEDAHEGENADEHAVEGEGHDEDGEEHAVEGEGHDED